MPEPLLQLTNVSVRFGRGPATVTAVAEANLSIEPGEVVAVMGPSGSGKSTLLAVAGTLTKANAGRVVIDGVDTASADAAQLATVRRQSVGFVFQQFNLVSSLTVIENVALPLELDGIPRRRARHDAARLLAQVELGGFLQRYPTELSGGQQQRVAIARAMTGSKRLILADEPTGALDSMTGELVLGLLRAQAIAGAGVLLVTHDSRHAAWADRIVMMRDGRIADDLRRSRPELLLSGDDR